jgi:hypothetical protein
MTKPKTKEQTNITIRITFKNGHHAEFTYTDPYMAKEHHTQFSAQGIVAGQIIKTMEIL